MAEAVCWGRWPHSGVSRPRQRQKLCRPNRALPAGLPHHPPPLSHHNHAHVHTRPCLYSLTRSAWELLDYGDVVVHVMTAEQREYYDLVGYCWVFLFFL